MRALLSLWDRLSLYLPITLMGLLALGTYWLVESTPVRREAVTERVARHEPDYFMKNFSVRTFVESGRIKSEVYGAAARHYPDTETLEIDAVRIRSFDDRGRLTTATANRALTNRDGSEVQLFGRAQIVRDAQRGPAGQNTPRIEFPAIQGVYARLGVKDAVATVQFIADHNAPALADIADRLAEAIDRGLWMPKSNSARTRIDGLRRVGETHVPGAKP